MLYQTCLDKISRLTANPGFGPFHRRVGRLFLNMMYRAGLYHIPSPAILDQWDDGACLHLRDGEYLTRRLWFRGYLEYDEEYFLRMYLREGMVVFDVGANVGHISLICGRRVGPRGQVHCFEPLGSTFEYLQGNILRNGLEHVVIPNRNAVASTTGRTVYLDYAIDHSYCTSLSLDAAQEGRQGVQTITLDDYVAQRGLRGVDFLKMDIEGSELLALQGAQQTITTFKPVILCEFNNSALQRLGGSSAKLWDKWKDLGYAFYSYSHRTKTLCRCTQLPPGDCVTLMGTTDEGRLVAHLGVKVRQ